ncbi:hypothetical protein HDV03_001810 [Kappamyces sp. JEL0829]|nr:hypothetical protein HDV03_001810 [Kappamyces sp. JEL0829]
MYGYSLIMPVQIRVFTEASKAHMNYAWRYCMNHLEDESSFLVVTLAHLMGYYAETKQVQRMTHSCSLALSAAKYLGFYRGENAIYSSPTGHIFNVLWITLFFGDVDIGVITKLPYFVDSFEIDEDFLLHYDESNTGDTAVDNYLSYPNVQIPLMGFCKKVHTLLQNPNVNKLEWLEVTRRMECWYDNLNPKVKCTIYDTVWKGFIISYINLRYISLQLNMVKKDLMASLATMQHHLIHTPLLQHCLRNLAIVTRICELILLEDRSKLDLMGIGILVCDVFAICGLYNLAIGCRCPEYYATSRRIIPEFVAAIEILKEGYSPQLLHQLLQAEQNPELAYEILLKLG